MKKLVILALLLCFAAPCLAEMLSIAHQPAELRDRAMVAGSAVIRQLPLYTPLEIVQRGAEYHQVKTVDGLVGYIHKSLTTTNRSAVVTAPICNVRSGPGTEFSVAFKASRGDRFPISNRQADWIQVKTVAGISGWIRQDLVWGE